MAAKHKGIAVEKLPHRDAKPTITPGEPMSRMMGQYGKGHSYLNASTDPAEPDGMGAAVPPMPSLPTRGRR